jgi:hypothetical protein
MNLDFQREAADFGSGGAARGPSADNSRPVTYAPPSSAYAASSPIHQSLHSVPVQMSAHSAPGQGTSPIIQALEQLNAEAEIATLQDSVSIGNTDLPLPLMDVGSAIKALQALFEARCRVCHRAPAIERLPASACHRAPAIERLPLRPASAPRRLLSRAHAVACAALPPAAHPAAAGYCACCTAAHPAAAGYCACRTATRRLQKPTET